jgi:nitrite reductase/ring-hydroxylating ferredoxin subunit
MALRRNRTSLAYSLASVTEEIETPRSSRRALFTGAGAVGAAALLAACSDDPAPSGGGSNGTTPGTGASGPAASPSGGGAGDGGAEVVAKTSDIPVGGGKIIADKGIVVTQPAAGTFKGFSNLCTHQQCPLADVSGGTINCNCHFSKFSITDGSVVSPPASQPLPAMGIKVSGSDITLA